MSKTKTKVDGYQVITDRIIESLEMGTVPWRKPWRSVEGFGPTSLSTGKEYRGINHLMLSMQSMAAGYGSIYWGTYRQIDAQGGQVRKGEKSTQVVLWKPFKKEVDGKEQTFLMLRLFAVFNAEQADWADGKFPSNPEPLESTFTPVEKAERIHMGMPQRPGDQARRQPGLLQPEPGLRPDARARPVRRSGPEGYYATLFHELVHATGHESRVGRQGIEAFAGFGSESYSKEELVAEIGAAILCAEAGIEPRIDQSAAYIASWLKVLKGDKKFVVAAAAGAGKAVDFILDRKREEAK